MPRLEREPVSMSMTLLIICTIISTIAPGVRGDGGRITVWGAHGTVERHGCQEAVSTGCGTRRVSAIAVGRDHRQVAADIAARRR